MFAKQIINVDIQLISAKTNQFSLHQPSLHPTAPHPFSPQPIQLNDIAGILTKRTKQIPNIYWKPGQPIGAQVSNFRQIKYLPFSNAVTDLNQAISGARLDCEQDVHKQLIEFGKAAKVWTTVQVEYEPVNPLANKQPFKNYLIAAPTRMFRHDKTISAFGNPYTNFLQILRDRIMEFKGKFIRVTFGLRLSIVL